jgi:hypothetical protein
MRLELNPNYLLRGVLAVFGAAIIFLGLNVGFGGIQTLGWQGGAVNFFAVTNEPVFAVHDNHIRFIGGVWLGLGLLMLAGAVAFQHMRPVLIGLTAMIFVGGVARLSAGNVSLLLSADLGPSFFLEIVIVPLLGLWLFKAERRAVRQPLLG